MLMFLGMAGLYFFFKYLNTSNKSYLLLTAFFFSLLFYSSYSSIPFITLSQILWFYRPAGESKRPKFNSFLLFNGLILLFCLSWIIFIAIHLKGSKIIDPLHTESPGAFHYILYGVLHDWVPHIPLMLVSILLFILFPFFAKDKRNALVLLAVFVLPIGTLYIFCTLLHITHFITSRYFINFLPLLLVTLYLSLDSIEMKFVELQGFLRLKLIFLILFIASNLIILPFYYNSEKQDFKGLVNYLKGHIQNDDLIIVGEKIYMHGMLHYFGIYPPGGREYLIPYRKVSEKEFEYKIHLNYKGNRFFISFSKSYWVKYLAAENRIWLVVGKNSAREIKKSFPFVLKGYFDGSFLNFNRFPTDVSMYLFLIDPKSPQEKGIDMPIE